MLRIIEISLLSRMTHPCRIPSHYIEICPRVHSWFCMPLNFCGPSIEHRRRKNCQHRRLRIQNPLLQHLKFCQNAENTVTLHNLDSWPSLSLFLKKKFFNWWDLIWCVLEQWDYKKSREITEDHETSTSSSFLKKFLRKVILMMGLAMTLTRLMRLIFKYQLLQHQKSQRIIENQDNLDI